MTCTLYRAAYERKKKEIQLQRYEQARDESKKKEIGNLTEEQIYSKLEPYFADSIDDRGRLSVRLLRVHAKDDEGLELPISKLNLIADLARRRHPELEDEGDEDSD